MIFVCVLYNTKNIHLLVIRVCFDFVMSKFLINFISKKLAQLVKFRLEK
jgi:hypothetical protein